jgi:hypothetical protein
MCYDEFWAFIRFMKPFDMTMTDSRLRQFGPYPEGFETALPLEIAWVLLRQGYIEHAERNGRMMIRKEVAVQ